MKELFTYNFLKKYEKMNIKPNFDIISYYDSLNVFNYRYKYLNGFNKTDNITININNIGNDNISSIFDVKNFKVDNEKEKN